MTGIQIVTVIEMRLAEINMSKGEFYNATGISSATFSQWRNGKYNPNRRILSVVSNVLSIPLSRLTGEKEEKLSISAEQTISEKAVSAVHILRGLISYHERMTMGDYPERDFYLDGLRFALACVEEKIN